MKKSIALLLAFATCVVYSQNIPCQTGLSQYRFKGKQLRLSEKEWKKRLTPEQFNILRRGAIEPPFYSTYYNHQKRGIYRCIACKLPLFSSHAQYVSKEGWPSFWAPISRANVKIQKPSKRVKCSRCLGYLGIIYHDGPPPTGVRFCIHSIALTFTPQSS